MWPQEKEGNPDSERRREKKKYEGKKEKKEKRRKRRKKCLFLFKLEALSKSPFCETTKFGSRVEERTKKNQIANIPSR